MRHLFLMRHGKARASVSASGDHDRPLTGGGREASLRMGAFCSRRENPPTLALCSPARRTRETCDAFGEGLETPFVEQIVENLYSASPETLIRAILEADNRHTALVVIGHNPGLQSLAIALGRLGPGPLFARLSAEFPPTALAVFETGIESWGAFRPESARLTAFTTPNDLT